MRSTLAFITLAACERPLPCAIDAPATGTWIAPDAELELSLGSPRAEGRITVDGSAEGRVHADASGHAVTDLRLRTGDRLITLTATARAAGACTARALVHVEEPVPVRLDEPSPQVVHPTDVPVRGRAAPRAWIAVGVDGRGAASGEASADGAFSLMVPASPGVHTFEVVATSRASGFVQGARATARVGVEGPASLRLFPDPASAASPLIARIVRPPDERGPPSALQWRWTRDGEVVPELDGPEVPAALLRRDQRWEVAATPRDGGVTLHAAATIGNAPPSIHGLRMTAPRPRVVTRCLWEFDDADGDADRSAVTWTLDGARLADGPLLPPLPLEVGHELACIITPSDGVATATRQVVTRHVESELRGNVLIVLLDDIGAYDLQLYDPTATFVTPRLDALAAEGLTFNRAWSTPFCAPTRAAAMTGRYPLRTGLGTNFRVDEPEASLPDAEVTWAEHVRATVAAPYRFAAVGKWHLATWPDGGGARVLDQGFDTYLGALGNLYDTQSIDGLPMDYFDWEKYDDAHVSRRQGYVTIDEAEDAIRLMREMPEPWVLWVATHAAHEPFAEPPLDALPWGPTTIAESGNRAKYAHMIEAVDAQIGNMVDAAPADTHIFVLADNGVPEVVADPSIPDNRMKGSVFEGGVRVPMIVRSPYVATPGARTDALAHVVDLFPTIVELAGGSTAGLDIDGRSLVDVLNDPSSPGPHPVIYTERFEPNGFGPYTRYDRAIRDASYKVVRLQDGVDRLYRLDGDLAEGVDLRTFALTPQEQAAYAALAGRLDRGDLR